MSISATINVASLPSTNCRYKFISFETLCWNLQFTKRNLKINDWICDSFVIVMDTCN
jgi:hypothetical protein